LKLVESTMDLAVLVYVDNHPTMLEELAVSRMKCNSGFSV
jgi:hypothetical protein